MNKAVITLLEKLEEITVVHTDRSKNIVISNHDIQFLLVIGKHEVRSVEELPFSTTALPNKLLDKLLDNCIKYGLVYYDDEGILRLIGYNPIVN